MGIITTAQDIDSKKIVHDGCMITFTGLLFDLMNPKPDDILIEDIAHGLAYNCRWNGATKTYFSIAEHCCMMYDLVPDHLKKTALMHDCEEAYWGDIIKPLKNLLALEIRNKMRELRAMIFKKYGVKEICEEIEAADFHLLQWDFQNLILTKNHDGWLPHQATIEWLERFEKCK